MGRRERRWGSCALLMVGGLTAVPGLTAVAGCGSGVGELVHSHQNMVVFGDAPHRDALAKSGLDGHQDAFVEDSRAAPKRGRQGGARRIAREKPAGRAVTGRRGVTGGPEETGVPTSRGAPCGLGRDRE